MARLITVGTKLAIPVEPPSECPVLCPDCTPLTPTVVVSDLIVESVLCDPPVQFTFGFAVQMQVQFPDACGFIHFADPIQQFECSNDLGPVFVSATTVDVSCFNFGQPPSAAWGLNIALQAEGVGNVHNLGMGYVLSPFIDCDPSGLYAFLQADQSPPGSWQIISSGTVQVA